MEIPLATQTSVWDCKKFTRERYRWTILFKIQAFHHWNMERNPLIGTWYLGLEVRIHSGPDFVCMSSWSPDLLDQTIKTSDQQGPVMMQSGLSRGWNFQNQFSLPFSWYLLSHLATFNKDSSFLFFPHPLLLIFCSPEFVLLFAALILSITLDIFMAAWTSIWPMPSIIFIILS